MKPVPHWFILEFAALICSELEQHASQNANGSDCEKANKQSSSPKEQPWKLAKENSNETSITPTVLQQYGNRRHCCFFCSCHMTPTPKRPIKMHGKKNTRFWGNPTGGTTVLRSFIGCHPWTDRQKFVEFCRRHTSRTLFPFELLHTNYGTQTLQSQTMNSDYLRCSLALCIYIRKKYKCIYLWNMCIIHY